MIMIGLIKLYVIIKMTLTDQEISKKIRELRKTQAPVYAPLKYFRGLKTRRDVEKRYVNMKTKTYTKFSTDKGVSGA